MNLNTCLVVMAWSPFLCCAAQDSFPPSSSLSWLRNRVFGSRQTEERFVNRMAMAAQSLVALVNDPVVVNELRRYYDSLMRNPDIAKLVESIRPSRPPTWQSLSTVKTSLAPTTTAATTPIPSTSREAASTNEALVSTTASTNTATAEPSWMTLNVTSRPVNRSVDVSSLPKVYTSHGYRFYFDPRLLVQPLNSSSVKARVRRHLNLLRLNDVDNCVSFLICEMSRYPLRYGPLGVKVDRFFRYPMWDTGSSAAHYAAMARTGRRHGCRGRISSCRYPIGPLPGRRYNFQYRNF